MQGSATSSSPSSPISLSNQATLGDGQSGLIRGVATFQGFIPKLADQSFYLLLHAIGEIATTLRKNVNYMLYTESDLFMMSVLCSVEFLITRGNKFP